MVVQHVNKHSGYAVKGSAPAKTEKMRHALMQCGYIV